MAVLSFGAMYLDLRASRCLMLDLIPFESYLNESRNFCASYENFAQCMRKTYEYYSNGNDNDKKNNMNDLIIHTNFTEIKFVYFDNFFHIS